MSELNPARNRSALRLAAASAAIVIFGGGGQAFASFDIVEKSVSQIEAAYQSGATNVAEVVNAYLARIKKYDDGPVGVNAVGQINPNLNADVAAAQALIARGASISQYPLLGVPVLIKDSYDAKGLITTNGVSVLNGSGTPGSTTLVAVNDAPVVASLKAAGAIILGKTNLSTMAYSFDGIDNAHGVVRNPYNYNRQPGGSSSGSGAAAASSFATLTFGGETGGSIRVPSTYNGLVGLKTSAGLIDPSGTWPLTPARDVVGPIARSVTDVALAMNAVVRPVAGSDLFANTPYYPSNGAQPGAIGNGLGEGTDPTSKGLTNITGTRPVDYTSFLSKTAMQGKVFAVPSSIVRVGASDTSKAYDGTVNGLVYDNFQKQLDVLRSQGATIKFVDVPAETIYFNTIGRATATPNTLPGIPVGGPTTAGFVDKSGNPIPYPTTTAGGTTPSSLYSSYAAAYYYEKQIEQYNDPVIHNLRDFANALKAGSNRDANGNPTTGAGTPANPPIVFPGSGSPFSTLNSAYANINLLAGYYEQGLAKGFGDADGDGKPDNPDAITQLAAFATLRQDYINSWMDAQGIDAIVAPTMGSVAPLVTSALRTPGTPSTDPFGGGTASLIGRFEGNILGLPALSVPSGTVGDGSLWTGLQFEGRFDGEASLLGYGYDYEQATFYRFAPDLTIFAAPEPASLAAIGGVSLIILRRRRQA